MSETEKILEIICDMANALEALAVNVKHQIAELTGVKEQHYDVNKIKWVLSEGYKGQYEKSEDFNSLNHKSLLKDLQEHKGKMTKDGWFYWVFENGSTIGRKKKQPKQA